MVCKVWSSTSSLSHYNCSDVNIGRTQVTTWGTTTLYFGCTSLQISVIPTSAQVEVFGFRPIIFFHIVRRSCRVVHRKVSDIDYVDCNNITATRIIESEFGLKIWLLLKKGRKRHRVNSTILFREERRPICGQGKNIFIEGKITRKKASKLRGNNSYAIWELPKNMEVYPSNNYIINYNAEWNGQK